MAKMTGKRALMEQLVADGVRYVFGNPGTTEQGFMDILQEYPQIEFMLALHEGVAVGMADAYARVTRRPAFVEVHTAPGLGNALGMIYNAAIGKTPMVVYAGHSPSRSVLQEPHLSGPLVDMARPLCKWAAEIHHAHDVPRALRRAFKTAMEPPQRARLPLAAHGHPRRGGRGRDRADDLHALARAGRSRRHGGRRAPAARRRAADGDGRRQRVALADAQPEAAAVAEVLGAPIFECYASEFNVSARHPLYVGSVNFVTPGAGARGARGAAMRCSWSARPCSSLIFPEPDTTPLPAGTAVIQIDLDSWELGKNITPTMAVLADPKAALAELAEQIRRLRTPEQARAAQERAGADRRAHEGRRAAATGRTRKKSWDAVPISAPRLMHEIRARDPGRRHGVRRGHHQLGPPGRRRSLPTEPGRLMRARGGGIGPGLPGTLGAQLARPSKKVVGVCSDGAAMYSITALWTAAHHRIPATFVMLNNGAYRILKLNMLEYLGPAAAGRQFIAMDLDRSRAALRPHGRIDGRYRAAAWSGPTISARR